MPPQPLPVLRPLGQPAKPAVRTEPSTNTTRDTDEDEILTHDELVALLGQVADPSGVKSQEGTRPAGDTGTASAPAWAPTNGRVQ